MLNLTRTTQKKLLRLLVPLLTNENSRDNVIYDALGFTDQARTLVGGLDTSGSPHDFTIRLIRQLANYGTVTDDEHGEIEALWAVMLAVHDRVGENHQRTITGLAAELNPVFAPSPVEAVDPLAIASDGAHVFISYSRANLPLVNRLVADLTAAGVPLWVDQVGLKAGTPDWEQAIRAAIREARCVFLAASPTSQRSAYVRDELAIADMHEVPIYPLWVDGEQWMDCIPMGRGYTQFIDLRGDAYNTNFTDVLAVVGETSKDTPEAQPETTLPPDFVPRNPYKGLRAFTGDDRADFFGREALIVKLVDALRDSRFLAIIGPSGSGKSSVAMAGLLPALQQDGALPGSKDWVYLSPMVPGAKPLDALRRALAGALPHKSQTAIREDLAHESTEGLAMLADEAANYDPDKRVVLYIDQFEELFALTDTDTHRNQFVSLLTTALNDPDNALTVVITLRADFYHLLSADADLAALAENNNVIVSPMSIDDLYKVIVGPTRSKDVRLIFEDGLVSNLLFDVRDEIGSLPLLQFALQQLFEHRQGMLLPLSAYREIGGVRGAIAKHAEYTFSYLVTDQDRKVARILFLRLVKIGQFEQKAIRKRINRDELDFVNFSEKQKLETVINLFVDARLLTIDGNTIQLSHEIIISEWKRFIHWIEQHYEDIRIQEKLWQAAQEWLTYSSPNELLYRGIQLRQIEEWQSRNFITKAEEKFIQASLKYERENIEREISARDKANKLAITEMVNKILVEWSEAKSKFFDNFEHEFHTPLNEIIGYSRVLLKGISGAITEQQEKDLMHIYSNAQSLLDVVSNLIGRRERINAEMLDSTNITQFELKPLLEEVIQWAQTIIGDKSISFDVSVETEVTQVYADKFTSRRIIETILSNSIRFTSAGEILISVFMTVDKSLKEVVCIEIVDNGLKITDDNFPDLYKVSAELDVLKNNKLQHAYSLTQARSIVQLQGGDLLVEPSTNSGIKICLILPTQPRDA